MKTGRQLAEECNLTYRQVHHWTARGYILPVDGDAEDSDPVLNFNLKEERILRMMAAFVEFGIKVSVAAELARTHVESGQGTSMFDIDGIGFIHCAG